MRRTEFIKAMEDYGLEVEVEYQVIKVRKNKKLVAEVYDNNRYIMGTYNDIMKCLNDDIVRHITNYACTPLDQREEPEKKYMYKLKVPYEIESFYSWLNLDLNSKSFHLSTANKQDEWQVEFTRSEVSHLDLSIFEEIEVE